MPRVKLNVPHTEGYVREVEGAVFNEENDFTADVSDEAFQAMKDAGESVEVATDAPAAQAEEPAAPKAKKSAETTET